MKALSKGTEVSWNWGTGKGHGRVAEHFTRDVVRTIKGEKVKRKASPDEPAYLIRQEDGGTVLKSHSEVTSV